MPIVQIELFEGRTVEQKREMAAKVTEAIVDSLGVPAEAVRIIMRDMAPENFAVAGKLRADK
ncbi:MAG: 4-oxalocrotonate tautomerase [Firmicutes bacterium]|jgi:4-oxalocrotonate tautomerase|nr:4-oxalocrotonate tautomerase [Bacillota bacterium]